MTVLTDSLKEPASVLLDRVIKNDKIRNVALDYALKVAYKNIMKDTSENIFLPIRTGEDRFLFTRNLLYAVNKALDNGNISRNARRCFLENLVGKVIMRDNSARRNFEKKYKTQAPGFVLVSPTSTCNLHCIGCYANSSKYEKVNMEYDIFSRIIREKRELWGSHFTVISGGEPLMWRSNGKNIIDIFREHKDNFFLMYTNGTLIDKKMAREMAEMGNVTPAVSLEGFEKETDKRRGKGTFKRILNALENLREAGVPFGVSLTATRENAEILLSDEFIDFCFEEQEAVYGWIFQYMPIGRHFTLDLMPTPEQRLEMYKKVQHVLREKKLFLADFWNSGMASFGCISAGRSGGYFVIDWKGDVLPCVFFPYTTHNILKVYKDGGDLNTVLFSPFFEEIRHWQNEYGYTNPKDETGNWIIPCPIKDHHKSAYEAIIKHNAKPADLPASEALSDERYHKGLEEYDNRIDELTSEIWERDYLQKDESVMDLK